MPIYEYACTSCGERTEAQQSFNDPPLEDCPHCGGKLRKLYSPVGIVFKGSGFYATDARKNGSKAGAKAESKPETKSSETGSADKSPKSEATGSGTSS